ncbi:hypothetical protein NMY22_g12892 [Coprinellus aureogranulatus]|nr:hypothetical protein NMY22_g12892 [Coprinellus aureogranulatus]
MSSWMRMFWPLPRIEYPLTKEFPSVIFTRAAYGAIFLSLIILTLVNVAIVGYETTVELSSNFNDTQSFWFHAFSRRPKPGTLCDPRVLNIGDSLATNASIYEWKIIAITRPSAGKSSIAYHGTVLCPTDTNFGALLPLEVFSEALFLTPPHNRANVVLRVRKLICIGLVCNPHGSSTFVLYPAALWTPSALEDTDVGQAT